MVVSGLILKIPYWIFYQVRKIFHRLHGFVFYVESEHDFYVIENILPHIEYPYNIVAHKKKLANELRRRGLKVIVWPAFPRVLFMTRHAFHRFPIKTIKKIGIKHGTYHFKKMIHPKKYNAFDLYIFTTEDEAEMAADLGITCGVVGGQPKIDTFFNKKTLEKSQMIKQKYGFDDGKITLLFTTTWDKSGLSAVDKWIDSLPELTERYNILVSLHPMMSKVYVEKVKSLSGVYFADSENLPSCMLAADVLISDTSSVMGEFCALNKPIITFVVEEGWRLTPEIKEMIKDISLQVNSIDEIDKAIKKYLDNPDLKSNQRQKWKKVFYGNINASHGKKVAKIINALISES